MTAELIRRPTRRRERALPHATKEGFRPDIEGMRAVAVVLVVLNHAGVPVVSGGYVGVDVFFVISGFLITGLLVREQRSTGSISIRRFYARRATRLLPLAVLVAISTVVASRLWLPPTRFVPVAMDAIASQLYVINYRLAALSTDYLNADDAPSPFQHFWSLSVEEQFYFVWPVLLIVVAALWSRSRRGSYDRLVGLVLGAVVVTSFALSVVQTSSSQPWAYFGIQSRAWELASGAFVALAANRLSRLSASVAATLTWGGLAMIGVAAVAYDNHTVFPGYAVALPVVGAVLVIAGGCARPARGARIVLETAPFQLVGRLSYGWYLWHWPILLIAPAALGFTPTVPRSLALAGAALVVTWLTHHAVENPIRYRRSLTRRPLRGLAVGATLSATAVVTALVAAFVVPQATAGIGHAPDTATLIARADDPDAELARLIVRGVGQTDAPANLTPTLTTVQNDRPVTYKTHCHLDPPDTVIPDRCSFGDPGGAKKMVLIGDSHAAQWFPALNSIARSAGWQLWPITKSACPAGTLDVVSLELKRDYRECSQWHRNVVRRVAQLKPDLVVLASSNRYQLTKGAATTRDFVDGWVDMMRRLSPYTARTIMIADTPWARMKVPDCVSANVERVRTCGASVAEAERDPQIESAVDAAMRARGVQVIQPRRWLCTDTFCPVIVGNLLVYRDRHHMTTAYASMLATVLGPELKLN